MRSVIALVMGLSLSTLPITAGAGEALQRLADDNGAAPRLLDGVRAAGPRLIGGLQLSLPGAGPAERTGAFVARYRGLLLPGDAGSQVVVRRVVDTPLGRVVHAEQRLDGLPVHGRGLVGSFDRVERLKLVVDGLRPVAGLARQAELCSPAQALALARRAHVGSLRGTPRLETAWLLSGGQLVKAHLVTVPGAVPLGDFTYVVVGPQGQIVWRYGRTPGAVGYAYPSNPVRDETYEQVELDHLTSDAHLQGEHVQVFNCTGSSEGSCNSQSQLAMPDANGDYLIEPTGANDPTLDDDAFVEVQAYYGINAVHDFITAIGAEPDPLTVGVNYPMAAQMGPNAYFSPQEQAFGGGPAIMMGQWQDIDLALDNDVIFHEYGHHVFGQYSQSGMFNMDEYGPVFYGLSLNEATADYFSCAALGDPSLGEYFASLLPAHFPDGYLRNVDNELTCPEGLYGEGHDDGMVWSGFAWAVRERYGAEAIDPLYLDVISHFPQEPDFPTATAVYIERAGEVLTAAQVAEIEAMAAERGIDDCTRFIPIRREAHTGFVYGKQILGQYANRLEFVPAELHYTLELPANAVSLELQLSSPGLMGGDVVLLVRVDQPVEHSFSYMGGLSSTYDFMLEEFGLIELDDPESPFEPGHTYYFHPVNRGQGNTEYSLRGNVATAEPDGGTEPDGGVEPDGGTDPDGGVDPDGGGDCPDGQQSVIWDGETVCAPVCKGGYELARDGDGWTCDKSTDGCGCATEGRAGAGLLLGLLGLGLVLRRRRCAVRS